MRLKIKLPLTKFNCGPISTRTGYVHCDKDDEMYNFIKSLDLDTYGPITDQFKNVINQEVPSSTEPKPVPETPDESWYKNSIRDWLSEHGIDFTLSDTKADLLTKITNDK